MFSPSLAAILLVPSLTALAPPTWAAYGSPILSRGETLLGVSTRQFKRDIFADDTGRLLNPHDTFGYVGLESRLGLWRDRLDFGLEVGRSQNHQDRFPDRDYLTWELGFSARGLLYRQPDGPLDVTGGVHFADTVAFDRSATLAHKLRRNYAAFVLVGRSVTASGRPLRIYAGPLYSRHEIVEYRGTEDPAKGETRSNLEILGGVSARLIRALEAAGEIEYREALSFGLSAGFIF